MPRAGNGTYSLPANTAAVSGDPISSTKYNTLVQDLESDANTDRPIAAGGTGASTAQAALTNLFSGATPGSADRIAFWDHSALAFGWLALGTGLSFSGTTLELDSDLSTIAGLTPTANNFIVGNAGGTAWEVKTPANARTSLGLGTIATQAANNVSITGGSVTGITDLTIADGGTGASDAGTARTNLGLAIGTNVQAYDAGLQSIAGLTTVADRSIYTTASDTYAVYTLTAAGRAILDDADAAAQRTTLGLGTAAIVNTGTSGGTVPLLNGANTWSGVNTFSIADPIRLSAAAGTERRIYFQSGGSLRWTAGAGSGAESGSNAGSAFQILAFDDAGGFLGTPFSINRATLVANFSATPTSAGNAIWHAGNDGAGSGLDADTLDGVQGSAYAPLASPALTGTPTINGAAAVSVSATQTLTNKTLTTPTINGGTIQSRPQAASETTGTLTVASANKTIQATGDITIPNAVFAAGDVILIYAGASARTITQGASVTMRLGGTATTGSRTLAARGVAVLFFVSSSEVVVSGGAVT
jgi:hypothetical protein